MCSQAYSLPKPHVLLNIAVSPQVPKSLLIFEPLLFTKLAVSLQKSRESIGHNRLQVDITPCEQNLQVGQATVKANFELIGCFP